MIVGHLWVLPLAHSSQSSRSPLFRWACRRSPTGYDSVRDTQHSFQFFGDLVKPRISFTKRRALDAFLAGSEAHLLFGCGRLLGLGVSDGVSEQDVKPRRAATDVYPRRRRRATAKVDAAFAIHEARAFCFVKDVID